MWPLQFGSTTGFQWEFLCRRAQPEGAKRAEAPSDPGKSYHKNKLLNFSKILSVYNHIKISMAFTAILSHQLSYLFLS